MTNFQSVLLRGCAALGVAAGVGLSSTTASACGIDPYIGEVCYFASDFCPQNYLAANGQVVPIAQNQVLFSLLGAYYGGDGRTTFGLPDMQGRVPVGVGTGVGLSPYVMGQKGGGERVTVANANLPTAIAGTVSGLQVQAALPVNTSAPSTTTTPVTALANGTTSNYLTNASAAAPSSLKGVYTTTAPVAGSTKATMPVDASIGSGTVAITGGGGQGVAVVKPYQALTACIATIGYYPPRP